MKWIIVAVVASLGAIGVAWVLWLFASMAFVLFGSIFLGL